MKKHLLSGDFKSLNREQLSRISGGQSAQAARCEAKRCDPNFSYRDCADPTGSIICYCSSTSTPGVFACKV